MKTHIDPSRFSLTALLLCFLILPVLPARSHDYDYVGVVRAPNATSWGGLRWTTTERNKFKGRPKMLTDNDTTNFVTVAYDRFVSCYDIKHFAPRWVAYVTDRASFNVSDGGLRTGDEFERPSQFFTDGTLADASLKIVVQPTKHISFTDRVPQGLAASDLIPLGIPATEAKDYPAYIERGHLAPNNAMKCWGTATQGKKAQKESFSLANVVPQMSAHNAPTWSALEAQCLVWANELGSVCVVAGPIYNNPASPRHIQKRPTGEVLDIPFADSLFCVVIGKRGNQISAVGFIMPHVTAFYSFKTKAVPIEAIEQATGINFMPLLNEPNPLELTIDQRWLNN